VLKIRVNATYAGSPLDNTGGIIWNVTIHNDTYSQLLSENAYFNSSDGQWWINITAPDVAQSEQYNLNVTGIYPSKGISINDTEINAVKYRDDAAPVLSIGIELNTASAIVGTYSGFIILNHNGS
jgi:hypothetical protein